MAAVVTAQAQAVLAFAPAGLCARRCRWSQPNAPDRNLLILKHDAVLTTYRWEETSFAEYPLRRRRVEPDAGRVAARQARGRVIPRRFSARWRCFGPK